MEIKETFLTEEDLAHLPLNYRIMVKSETKGIKELYSDTQFSESSQHHSKSYINYDLYKPISNISISAILKNSFDEQVF